MFKKLLPLIVVFALLAAYAGYRAVDARASMLAAGPVTSLDSAPAAYIASAQDAQAGTLAMGPVTSLDSAPAAYIASVQSYVDPDDCNVPRVRSPGARAAPVPSC